LAPDPFEVVVPPVVFVVDATVGVVVGVVSEVPEFAPSEDEAALSFIIGDWDDCRPFCCALM
jgi:hypothetical protein